MKKIISALCIISHVSICLCDPVIITGGTALKCIVVVAGVGGAGYGGHKITKKNAKQNITNIIQDMNENHRANDERIQKTVLKKYGHVFNSETNKLVESYLNLHDTTIPSTYHNIASLVIGQNLNRDQRRDLIEILRAAHQKPLAALWLYRELKEIKGQKIIDHIQNQ